MKLKYKINDNNYVHPKSVDIELIVGVLESDTLFHAALSCVIAVSNWKTILPSLPID